MYTWYKRSDNVVFSEGIFHKRDFQLFDLQDCKSASHPQLRTGVPDKKPNIIKVRFFKWKDNNMHPSLNSDSSHNSNQSFGMFDLELICISFMALLFIGLIVIIIAFCRKATIKRKVIRNVKVQPEKALLLHKTD